MLVQVMLEDPAGGTVEKEFSGEDKKVLMRKVRGFLRRNGTTIRKCSQDQTEEALIITGNLEEEIPDEGDEELEDEEGFELEEEEDESDEWDEDDD